MKLNAIKLANAVAVTTLVLYTVCTIFVALAPEFSMVIFEGSMHIPGLADTLGRAEVTIGGFLLGLIPMLIYSYAGAYLVATLYNRSIKE